MDRRIAASLCLVLAGVANAQPDRLGSYTIDGGGGSLTGPTYTLSGTVDAHTGGGGARLRPAITCLIVLTLSGASG